MNGDNLQYELFGNTWEQRFKKWVHTSGGRWVANQCIRYAYAAKRRGLRRRIKLIWELVREDLERYCRTLAATGRKVSKVDGYAMNDGFTASMARFVEEHEPSLAGYFTKHAIEARKARKAVIVPLK